MYRPEQSVLLIITPVHKGATVARHNCQWGRNASRRTHGWISLLLQDQHTLPSWRVMKHTIVFSLFNGITSACTNKHFIAGILRFYYIWVCVKSSCWPKPARGKRFTKVLDEVHRAHAGRLLHTKENIISIYKVHSNQEQSVRSIQAQMVLLFRGQAAQMATSLLSPSIARNAEPIPSCRQLAVQSQFRPRPAQINNTSNKSWHHHPTGLRPVYQVESGLFGNLNQ